MTSKNKPISFEIIETEFGPIQKVNTDQGDMFAPSFRLPSGNLAFFSWQGEFVWYDTLEEAEEYLKDE